MQELKAKFVNESSVDGQTYKVFANDLNSNDTVFGGLIMSILDRVAVVVAERHSQKVCVTASVDSIRFQMPAKKGDTLIIHASLNRAWHSSMEIGLKVIAENFRTGEQKHVLSAYFNFVALDENNHPTAVPPVIPQTDIQKMRYEAAEIRRNLRLSQVHP